jgi:hypothetical protein
MVDTGWVKVHRKIMDKGYYKRSQYVHLWIHILLKASHNETEFMWNGKIEKLMPGQFVTGRKQLSVDTGISQSTVERILETLESEHQIGQQKTNKFRLLTVTNWIQYQKTGQQNGQQMDNKWTTNGQQMDTFKNDKNVRIKEIKSMPPTIEELKSYIQEKKYDVVAEKFFAYYESNGWMVGKNKMKSWRAALVTWHHGNYGTPKKQSTAWGSVRTEENKSIPFTDEQRKQSEIENTKLIIANLERLDKQNKLTPEAKIVLTENKTKLAELAIGGHDG